VLLFRRQDRTVHNFLMAGRYPTLDAFIAVFHVLETASAPMALADIQKAAQPRVALSKVRVILSSLKDAGMVAGRRGARFTVKKSASVEEIARIAKVYLDRADDDREKLERMVIYGQTALCRWAMILKYFGEVDVMEQCGHCDNCAGTAITATATAAGVADT
jgi:hypothetical protein